MAQKDYEAQLHELERQNIECIDELAKRDSTIHGLKVRVLELEARLGREKGVVASLKQLYHSVDNKIMHTLTEQGQRKRSRPREHPAIYLTKDMGYGDLIEAAREYDAKEFFAWKRQLHRHNLRLGYRITAKGYRVVRDSSLSGAKKLHKLRAGE